MPEEWKIARGDRICARSGKTIAAGEPYFSALKRDGDTDVRLDFSVDAWPEVDKGGFFSYWRRKGGDAADADDRKFTIDFEHVLAYFNGLEGESGKDRLLFRHVLALMLVRRRLLRLDGVREDGSGKYLELFDRRKNAVTEVFEPEATPAELREVQERLNQLFECELDRE